MPDRRKVLDGAAQAVLRERNKTYGEPDEDFQRIARIASAMGFRMAPEGSDGPHRELKGSDVSLFMIALKTSRLVWAPDHEDSWTDIAGYAACGFETAQLQTAREEQWTAKELNQPEVTYGGDNYPEHRRLGISLDDWAELKELADRVHQTGRPNHLEDLGFMLITTDEPTKACWSDCDQSETFKERHQYAGACFYRIRRRRKP